MSKLALKILEWQTQGKVGVSSATMAAIAVGLQKPFYGSYFGYPYDPADFNRCMNLVDTIPEIRDHFEAIGQKVPPFKNILDNWEELKNLLLEEKKNADGRAPRTYARMKELLGRDA